MRGFEARKGIFHLEMAKNDPKPPFQLFLSSSNYWVELIILSGRNSCSDRKQNIKTTLRLLNIKLVIYAFCLFLPTFSKIMHCPKFYHKYTTWFLRLICHADCYELKCAKTYLHSASISSTWWNAVQEINVAESLMKFEITLHVQYNRHSIEGRLASWSYTFSCCCSF